MFPGSRSSVLHTLSHCPSPLKTAPRALYATVRGVPSNTPLPGVEEHDPVSNDFILSILRANPSLRDTKSYLAAFGGPKPVTAPRKTPAASTVIPEISGPGITQTKQDVEAKAEASEKDSPVVTSILNPVYRRTALVKMQGPFSDRQLESVARGMVYLEKLGLVSVIVVELDHWVKGEPGEKNEVIEETMRIVNALEKQGARARPVLQTVVRLGPKPNSSSSPNADFDIPEAHTAPSDLNTLRSALRAGEIPVLPPFALDSFCRSVRVDSNDVIGALAQGMVEFARNSEPSHHEPNIPGDSSDVDLTPLRLMMINREGGVPSYARSGFPHLLINLTGEFEHINDTFHESWKTSHPTSLSNLSLARTCLSYMPPSSSAIMVSHRSPSALIGNLITNKPELSSSLPHALLQNNRKLTPHIPTIIRRGLPIRVVNSTAEIDKAKMTTLLEQSFGRVLNQDDFYSRLEQNLDFAIIAGDYAGAAIVTREQVPGSSEPIVYLDKFAVLPSHQGDGTVDFLWVALHDESYGLGLSFSVNPNGGKEGRGLGRDLVWRSRSNNPVNKWYFERSTGHLRMGNWTLFWCDAEKPLNAEGALRGKSGLSHVETWEKGRLSTWCNVVPKIPSSWIS